MEKETQQMSAVITGANSGVGFSLADRLLSENANTHVCLACRNKDRAETARIRLLENHPGALISVIIVDTSSIKSVFNACQEIRQKFATLDMLYLNAGIMKVSRINWSRVAAIFSSEGFQILNTGCGVLQQEDNVTDEGLQEVFATNVFGHFVMVRELSEHYGGDRNLKVVWTGSQNADVAFCKFDDLQHKNGTEPYSSSKYATDLVSVALNDRFNSQGIYSAVISPGLVFSNLTFGILPGWLWTLFMPFLWLMRIFVSSLTCNPYNGAESLIWMSKQKGECLDPRAKYHSCVNVLGTRYTGQNQLQVKDEHVGNVYSQLETLYQEFRCKYSGSGDCNANGFKHTASNGLKVDSSKTSSGFVGMDTGEGEGHPACTGI